MPRQADGLKYEEFCRTALERVGVDSAQAAAAAKIMRLNDELGIATHGSFHLLTYVKKMRVGSINPGAVPTVTAEGPAWARLDAQDGLGFIASRRAMEIAIEKAKIYGLAYVGVYRSSHFGSCAAYTLQAVE
ncbi:MAG: Ldh family oxidoreductase, partial [Candidatus Adiutrix sp.]|nr:Ldh family oxidoreductase [Candidatus Adiutrix sp.]